MNWKLGLALAIATLTMVVAAHAQQQPVVRVAADAAMGDAMTDLAAAFERDGGAPVHVSLGNSRQLGRQIAAGAPYTLFLSADQGVIEDLIEAGEVEDLGELFARSGLVLHVRRGAPMRAEDGLEGLGEAMERRRLGRVVMPDPAVSSHGRAARESLLEAGLWADLQTHISLTRNAVQARRRVDGGPAQAAILPVTLTRRYAFDAGGDTAGVPGELHAPVEHFSLVLEDVDDSPAQEFQDFLLDGAGQEILEDYGFDLPPF